MSQLVGIKVWNLKRPMVSYISISWNKSVKPEKTHGILCLN